MKMNTSFKSRDFEQIIQKSIEPFGLIADAAEEFVPGVRFEAIPVAAQRGRGRRDGRKWRAQIV
jgi:hypothetical protein